MYNTIYPNINFHRYNYGQNKNSAGASSAKNLGHQNKNYTSNEQQTFPNGTKVAIDYTKGQINISQVLTDFRNTIVAINAPNDVKDEVYQYLDMVDRESRKESPNRDIVLANLKNASKISDDYIANSLNKPSNVVEGWIDALFLQKINLKANPDEVNPDYLLEFPKKAQEKIEAQADSALIKNEQEEKQPVDFIEQENELAAESKEINAEIDNPIEIDKSNSEDNKYTAISQNFSPIGKIDAEAKEMFAKTKALPKTANGYTEAVNLLNEALGLMENEEDVNGNIKAAIHLERGKIFDKYDYVDYALRDYHEATKGPDLNLKANAYYKSGKIYDEFSEFSPALDNYLSSVAYSGEADNYVGQITVLSKIADLYARQYDMESFDNYSSLAVETAQETDNDYLLAQIYSNNAQNYQYLGADDKALDNYKNAIELFHKSDESFEEMAYNYEQASIVMEKAGNPLKAQKLQQKALQYYQLAQQFENQ